MILGWYESSLRARSSSCWAACNCILRPAALGLSQSVDDGFGTAAPFVDGGCRAESIAAERSSPRSALVMIFGCFVEFVLCSRAFRAASTTDWAGCDSCGRAGAANPSTRTATTREADDDTFVCDPMNVFTSYVTPNRAMQRSGTC